MYSSRLWGHIEQSRVVTQHGAQAQAMNLGALRIPCFHPAQGLDEPRQCTRRIIRFEALHAIRRIHPDQLPRVFEKFYQADSVTFDGTAPGIINLVGSIQPAAITVNSAADYTFSGGTIDAGALTKSGTGTLTLASANAFGGGTVINGGTVAFATGGLSTGGIVMAGGAVRWHGANTEDISVRTVIRDWNLAKAWLYRELNKG